MQKKWFTSLIFSLIFCLSIMANEESKNTHVLLKSYFNYTLINEVTKITDNINSDDNAKAQINEVISKWKKDKKKVIRNNLKKQFNNDAKSSFAFFINKYTTAESKNDLQYLNLLTSSLDIRPAPISFNELQNIVINKWLKDEVTDAGALLSEIQTWNDLYKKNKSTPSLDTWLNRDKNITVPSKPSLKNVEPDLPEYVELDEKDESTMDIYDNLQSKRRAKTLEESQKYMKQIAAERKAAEEDYAQRKAAAADKEAAAVKAHAQKLAAAEKEIMEQRKHTWSARLSKLATTVAGGAFSAVTTGIGSAAGASAADAIFN